MPPTLRDQETILADLITTLLTDPTTPTTDLNPGSVVRTLEEAAAASMAELYYAIYQFYQATFIGTGDFGATGADLDTRGEDFGLARDIGQAASGSVLYTRVATWAEDILLPPPQILTVTRQSGVVSYRSVASTALLPQGRSVSDLAPATTLTGGVNDQLRLTVNGDGVRTLTLGTQASGPAIASAIQTAVRGLAALTPTLQPAYDGFRCDWSLTNVNALTLRSGTPGPASSVVVTPALTHDATAALKLGLVRLQSHRNPS